MNRADQPIAILASGLGGLTLVRTLRRILPGEDLLFLGDTLQGPLGAKSPEAIVSRSLRVAACLEPHRPKLLVVASHAASACALAPLQAAFPAPVLGVIEPCAQTALAAGGPVGVISSQATLRSGAYGEALRRQDPAMAIHALACPLLEPLAEQGWLDDPLADALCRRYLNQIPFEARTVILGSSPLSILLPSLVRTRPGTRWVDGAECTAQAAERMLAGGLGFRTASAQGALRILLTDEAPETRSLAERFLREPLEALERIPCP